jgi:N-acetylated-alpha-linked acidic dipeptidase
VLVEGLATPAASLRASRAGALGQIHISAHEHLHEMCISPVWGSPDTDTVHLLPSTVVLTIDRSAGERIKGRIADGKPVEATINAEIDTGWRATPLLVAELPPSGQTVGPFVLFSGHHDTWHYGVMDNGGANAVMLEVARIVVGRRTEWQRGLRLCFWSGHSHGRYSGSAWYADHRWQELERRCAVHVYVDSAGAKGNTVLADMPVCAELKTFAREVILEQGQQELTGLRMSRAGDQSFWGIGVPSLFMTVGEQPLGSGENVLGSIFAGSGRKGAGFGWWWHTPDDTLDKMDEGLLGRDTRIYLHAIWALLTSPILPLDYEAYAASLAAELGSLRDGVEPVLDLRGVIARVEHLAAGARALKEQAAGSDALDNELANAALMKLSRCLVPLDYTSGDRFGHDPALPQTAFPVLDPLRLLVRMREGSEGARFAAVGAVRARNRIRGAIEEAIQIVEGALGPNPVARN